MKQSQPVVYANLWGRRIVARDDRHSKQYMTHAQASAAAEKIAAATGVEHWPFPAAPFHVLGYRSRSLRNAQRIVRNA